MTIKLRAYNPVTVELGDRKFQTIDLPHEQSKRFQDLMEQMAEISDDADGEDAATVLMLEAFDLLLTPADDGRGKASTLLKKGLDAGNITPRQFIGLWTDVLSAIQEANGTDEVEGEIDRPT